jgi:dihydrofolate reductase
MIVSAIAAAAKNRVIGANGKIPWYLPADLKYFKRTTLHHHVIMGRKTYMSLGKPLPKRTNIILTRDPFFMASNCLIAHTIEEALSLAYDNGEEEAFIAGGAEIYTQSLPYWDKLYLTEVELEPEGDAYFPEIDEDNWKLIKSDAREPDAKNKVPFTFKLFERISSEEE